MQWLRVAGDLVVRGKGICCQWKANVSVRKETNAVSDTRVVIDQDRHPKLLHPLSHQTRRGGGAWPGKSVPQSTLFPDGRENRGRSEFHVRGLFVGCRPNRDAQTCTSQTTLPPGRDWASVEAHNSSVAPHILSAPL